ncbi:MAG: STAS domain-containing protein [Clostridia bacterium]|nr:STAS domain-containing protein [Clostridia bacterium]
MSEKNSVIYAIGGEIDHHTAGKLRCELDSLIMDERPCKLTFDFTNVKFMDSSGIGLVLGRHRIMSAFGGTVEIIGVSENIRRLFKMSGVDKIIDIK